MAKAQKHWTQLQAEEAERTPIDSRPFCRKHRRVCEWRGVWMCLGCLNNLPRVRASSQALKD